MNSLIQTQMPIMNMTVKMRHELLGALSDADLSYSPGGENPTFGELFRNHGQITMAYIESFETQKLDYTPKPAPEGVAGSVDALKTWFTELEGQFGAAIAALDEADVQGKMIDRGHDTMPVMFHVHIFREAVLIFVAQAVVYLRAMGREVPSQTAQWIG